MDDHILKKNSDINQCISNVTETSSERKSNNFTEPKLPIIKDFSEKVFDTVIVNIKTENDDEFFNNNDSEDYALLNVSESNSQRLTDTAFINGEITSVHTSSPSTAFPITQISPKSTPHTCLKCCVWCDKVFRVLDSPYHISRIRSIDKQNKFLKINPSLEVDSCLCDFCWKDLEKCYKKNMAKIKKCETFEEKRHRLLERHILKKNKSQARICSIHCCSKIYHHKISVKQFENIKKMISTFHLFFYVFVQSRKTTPDFLNFPFCLCQDHSKEINVMLSCQICGKNLNEHFNADDWSMYDSWNRVLFDNNISLVLKPGMFICVICKGHISQKNPVFPIIGSKKRIDGLSLYQEYVLMSKEIRDRMYGEPEFDFFIIYQGYADYASQTGFPIVVPKIKEKNRKKKQKIVCSTKVMFSDPLITATYHFESDYDENHAESITSPALLNVAEQNLCIPKLEPKDEKLDSAELEEEHFKILSTTNEPKDQLYSFCTDPIPDKNGVEIINSNKYPGVDNVDLLQNHCQVNNVSIDKTGSKIIDSHQVFTGFNEIKNNQSLVRIIRVYSEAKGSVAQDRSSMDLKEGNQYMNEINTIHKNVYSNQSNNSMCSFIAAVEPHNTIVHPVSLKRKKSNVVCHRIPQRDVKKQRLNEKSSSYEYNSTGNNTAKSYKNQNNDHSTINSPSILNMISNCKNEHVLNSDFIDVQDLSSCVDEESLKLHSNSMKNIELNTNVPSIRIENAYSLNSSCVSSHNFKRTSKKMLKFHKKKKLSRNGVKKNLLFKDKSNSECLSDSSIFLSDSDSLSDFEIVACDSNILLDSETFSETGSEETSYYEVKETDFIVGLSRDDLNSDLDSKKSPDTIILNTKNILENTTPLDSEEGLNCETVTDVVNESECIVVSDDKIEYSGDNRSQHIVISDNEDEIDNRKLCTHNIVSDVKKESNCEILLDGEKRECVANRRIECIIVSDDEIEPSGDNGSQRIVISDNEDEIDNRKLYTHNIVSDVKKGSNCKILLDGEKRGFVANRRIECIIVSDDEIEPSGDNGSQHIVISDNEDEIDNRKLYTHNIVPDVKKGSNCKILLDGEKRGFVANGRIERIIVSDDVIEPSGDNGSQHIVISDNEDEIDNRKLYTHNIVPDVKKGSNCEILLDGEKRECVANRRIERIIVSDDVIEPSDDNGSQSIVISDNEDEIDNRKLCTHDIISNVKKGSNCEILLDSGKREFVSEGKDKEIEYIIVSVDEIEPSDDNGSQCVILSDDEDEIDNRKLCTYNIVSDVKKGSNCQILLDSEKHKFVSESEEEEIEYIIVSVDDIEPSDDNESQCIVISDNEEEFNNKKVSDIKIISNDKIIVDDSQALKMSYDNNTINNSKMNSDKRTSQLRIKSGSFKFPCLGLIFCEDGQHDAAINDEIQKYFKEIFSYIRYFVNNSEDQSLKNLYSMIGNEADMLLYLMENFRMLYNGELVVSETASKFSEDYYNEQITILYNHYGHPKDNINASKPFILRSSHLHQYSKRLSNIEPVIIKDIMTTTGSSTHRGSIVSPKVTVAANKPISKVSSKLTTIRPPKSFPLYDSVSKSKGNIIPTKSKSIVQNKLSTYTKPLLTSVISHSPDDIQTLTSSALHPTKVKIQLPVAIRLKTIRKPEVYHRPPVKQPPTIQLLTGVRSSTMLTKPPVLLRPPYLIGHSANNVNCNDPINKYILPKNQHNK